MAPSKEAVEDALVGEQRTNVNRKKRLSRREQKARKKQRKQEEQKDKSSSSSQQQQQRKQEPPKKNNTSSSKNGTNRKDSSDSSRQSIIPADHNNNDDPWKVAPVQEDIPYVATTIPNLTTMDTDGGGSKKDKNSSNNNKTLGKWFPKARVVKSRPSVTDKCTILLFYQYKSPVVWNERKVAQLMQYLQAVAEARPTLGGRLRVAPEGINATISCGDAFIKDESGNRTIVNSRTILEHFTKDLQQFDEVFQQTDFKYIPAKADRHFKDLKILPVQELVFYGLQEAQAPLGETGAHLDAKDFHKMLQDKSKETVVVDVRNHYEAALGRFDGQQREGGATYIDPLMRKSTDFPSWVEQAADDLKGKRVMMYCTGGVRCERASAYLKKTMGESLDGVFQLQGGIERYLQAFPDGGHWRGANFVFDKRESVSATNPNGDGGVVAGKKKKKMKQQQHNNKHGTDNNDIQTRCCLCDRPWDRYVGKKKCETCGVPVLMCDSCMSTHHTRKKMHNNEKDSKTEDQSSTRNKEEEQPRKLARCPLCVDQKITVPVDEVEYTDNGVKSKCHSDQGKAAPSVLKWGGGHAMGKKGRRRKRKQYGAETGMEDDSVSQAD